jgi:hypothetical protein
MTVRKPTILRWSEEAEANHVREWAELDRDVLNRAARPDVCSGRPHRPARLSALVARLKAILGSDNPEIMQDG